MRPPTLKGWGNRIHLLIERVMRHIAKVIDTGEEELRPFFGNRFITVFE